MSIRDGETVNKAIAKAESEGFRVIKSDDFHLLIDLDSYEAVAQFNEQLPILEQYIKVEAVETWPSKSGNKHVYITLSQSLAFPARMAIQMALGSDPKRDLLSLLSHLKYSGEFSLLFVPKRMIVE